MKKILKLSSLAIVLMALLTLTACAPKADKAEEKMEKAGYFSIDAKAIVGTETSKYENFFVFAKGDNAINAAANMLTGGDFVVALYYKDAEEAKKAYDEYKASKDEEEANVKKSGKCLYCGIEQGMKDFA